MLGCLKCVKVLSSRSYNFKPLPIVPKAKVELVVNSATKIDSSEAKSKFSK